MRLKKYFGIASVILLFMILSTDVYPQQQKGRSRRRVSRWPWKGPEIGSVIKDFELPILDGGKFKLSDHRGKIVIIELGACT